MNKLSIKSLILTSFFTALIAIGAFIKIPVPMIPFSLQIFFTSMAGLMLGAKLGTMSVLIYLILGLSGIPVFTNGGGLNYIFQPTFGYIVGFLFGTLITGYISYKRRNPSFRRLLTASILGLIIVYIFGMVYYYCITNFYLHSCISVKSIFIYCFLVFIPGDLVLCILSSIIAKRTIFIRNNTNFLFSR